MAKYIFVKQDLRTLDECRMEQHNMLRPFDLKVGDIIQGFDPNFNVQMNFKVVHISEYVMTVESLSHKYKTSFQKKDYQLGFVRRQGEHYDPKVHHAYSTANSAAHVRSNPGELPDWGIPAEGYHTRTGKDARGVGAGSVRDSGFGGAQRQVATPDKG